MINVKSIDNFENYEIDVQPSNKLFKELGNNTYDFNDLISEFIDNSISARIKSELLNIEIEIGICETKKDFSYIIIRDNAKGIDKKVIGKAISPAEGIRNEGLNEHGLGMKQAIAALGNFKYIATKTEYDAKTIIVEELKFGIIDSKLIKLDWMHGTEICVSNLQPIVPKTSISYTKTVIKYLGARYRKYLKTEKPKMNLVIRLLFIDECGDVESHVKEWDVIEVKPIYFHPYKRKNEPVLRKEKLKGLNWEAEFTFGYAPTEEEYDDMELEHPKNYEPYTVAQNKQGFDVIKNDRVINFHQLSELELVPSKHSKYNYIRGEIDLKKGFVTATTKNYVIQDSNFKELISQIHRLLTERKYLDKTNYNDELPEDILRDRLAEHFKKRTLNPINDVITEYAVEGLGGFIDVLANGEAWELKIIPVSGLDIYQLFAYMDMGNIERGYILAYEFKSTALATVDFINKNHKKLITIVCMKEFPINQIPNEEEIRKYFKKR